MLIQSSWILVTAATGFAVGFLRWLFKFPRSLPGIISEINDGNVNPTNVPLIICLSAVSICGGACLGPEFALVQDIKFLKMREYLVKHFLQSNFGGGLSTLFLQHYGEEFHSDDHKLIVWCGMAAALGSLFPSSYLAALLILELSPKETM